MYEMILDILLDELLEARIQGEQETVEKLERAVQDWEQHREEIEAEMSKVP